MWNIKLKILGKNSITFLKSVVRQVCCLNTKPLIQCWTEVLGGNILVLIFMLENILSLIRNVFLPADLSEMTLIRLCQCSSHFNLLSFYKEWMFEDMDYVCVYVEIRRLFFSFRSLYSELQCNCLMLNDSCTVGLNSICSWYIIILK